MDLIRKIPKKFTKKFGNKVINRQYFRRKTGLKSPIFMPQIAAFKGKIHTFGQYMFRLGCMTVPHSCLSAENTSQML